MARHTLPVDGPGTSPGATGAGTRDRFGSEHTPETEAAMNTIEQTNQTATLQPEPAQIDFKLEVVVLPVSDVDRAKQFYESLGWRLDADFPIRDDFRVVQLTPPGSPASIIFGTGITAAEPGSAEALVLAVH